MRTSALALVIVAVLSGCGGGGNDRDTDTTGAPVAAGSEGGTPAASTMVASTPDTPDTAATAATGDGSIDPCRLITADEAAEVLGGQPVKPTNVKSLAVRACTYRLSDGSAAVQINTERGDGSVFKSQINEGNGDPVEGVGDVAKMNVILGQITVVKGDTRFAIFVTLANQKHVDAATLTKLATTATGRL